MNNNTEYDEIRDNELFEKARAHFLSGRYQESIVGFDEILNIGGEDISTLINNTSDFSYGDKYLFASFLDALDWKGRALYELGRYAEAIEAFDTLLKAWPKDVDAMYSKAVVLNKLENYDAALALLGNVIKIDPNSISALIAIGYAYLKLGKENHALAAFDAVLKIDPKNEIALHNQGYILDHTISAAYDILFDETERRMKHKKD